jgi:hypothetical protein
VVAAVAAAKVVVAVAVVEVAMTAAMAVAVVLSAGVARTSRRLGRDAWVDLPHCRAVSIPGTEHVRAGAPRVSGVHLALTRGHLSSFGCMVSGTLSATVRLAEQSYISTM